MEKINACPSTMKPKDYKSGTKPVWCPGCGDYSVLLSITKAMAELGLAKENVALVSGIGCSSRLPAYLDFYGFHSVHGRALPVATGLKVARPDLTVLAAGGDGDGFSIGGNHFMHACRRNVDMTYIVMDNQVYGMTKGQASPTTDPDWDQSKLTPDGTKINPYYPLVIALASGANFIARASSTDPNNAAKVLVDAIKHPGFSFVHMLSPCVTFRPEQKEWKKMVHQAPKGPTSNPAKAAKRLMSDDNFFLGTLYQGDRKPFQPELVSSVDHISELEAGFKL